MGPAPTGPMHRKCWKPNPTHPSKHPSRSGSISSSTEADENWHSKCQSASTSKGRKTNGCFSISVVRRKRWRYVSFRSILVSVTHSTVFSSECCGVFRFLYHTAACRSYSFNLIHHTKELSESFSQLNELLEAAGFLKFSNETLEELKLRLPRPKVEGHHEHRAPWKMKNLPDSKVGDCR